MTSPSSLWLWSQSTGHLLRPGPTSLIGVAYGYSGNGEHKNNPLSEAIRTHGPIPCGLYLIGQPYPHPKLGPLTMNLDPIGHDACGRSAFRIHGDSAAHPGAASDGCIVLARTVREMIATSADRLLLVISAESGRWQEQLAAMRAKQK